MENDYRESKLIRKGGYCFFQNGTYDVLSNKELWETVLKPALDMLRTTEEPYRFFKLGIDDSEEISAFLDEMGAVTEQIGKFIVKIKRAGGGVLIIDSQYFMEKIETMKKDLAEIKYSIAKIKEKAYAVELVKEYRICIRQCVKYNLIQINKLRIMETYGDQIEISEESLAMINDVAMRAEQDNVVIAF